MADNYLERKQEEYLARKAAADKAKRLAWKKRMDAYRKQLASSSSVPADLQSDGSCSPIQAAPTVKADLQSAGTDVSGNISQDPAQTEGKTEEQA